jgi:putative tricarboxylic transport membrane protein
MALSIVILILYAVFLEDLGFIVATVVAVAILSWRLGARPLIALANGAGVALVLYGLFDLALGLPLPLGLLEMRKL